MRQDPILDSKSLEEFYANDFRNLYWSDTFNSLEEEFNYRYNNQVHNIFDYTSDYIKKGRMLDCGCSFGYFVKYYNDHNFQAYGVEPDEQYSAYGRSIGLNVTTGDIERIDDTDNFDLILMNHVFENISDILSHIKKVDMLLNQNGYLFIGCSGLLGGVGKNGKYANRLLGTINNAHIWYFTLSTLRYYVENNSSLRLVSGDETIDAMFKKIKDAPPFDLDNLKTEYKNIIKHQRKAEFPTFYLLKRTLQNIYLYEPIRKIYHAIKKG